MRKVLRIFGILVVLMVAAALIFSMHLRTTNRLFYATGTKDKAFLNATWRMSPPEIERANHVTLSLDDDLFVLWDAPDIININRFTEYKQKDISLWGYPAELHYLFFDRMLYKYYINMTAHEPDKPMKDVLNTLQEQFGTGKPTPENAGKNFISYLQWDTPKQRVYCWLGTKDKIGSYKIGIRAEYKPLTKQLEDIAKAEKKKYF
jgi:hypothetical protein